MAYTPNEILAGMKKAKANGDAKAVTDLRTMLKSAYEAETVGAATEGMSGIEKFGTGLTSGFVDVGRKATNLVLPESLTPDWASDESIQQQTELDSDLLSTGAGLAGNLVSSIAATAPIGGGAGGVALKGAARLLPKALSGARTGAKLGRGLIQGAAQGGAEGLVLASPDNRGMGAGVGAALGGGMPLIARSVGALTRKLGRPAVQTTEASDELLVKMRESGVENPFIPLSHSAKPGIVRQLYQGIVANIPGNKVRAQYGEAVEDFRQAVVHEAVPDGVAAETIFEAGDSARDGFRRLNRAWDEVWEPVNTAEIMIPPNIVPDAIVQQAKKITRGQFSVPQPGRGTGQDLTRLSRKLQELADMQEGMIGADDAMMYIGMKNRVDDVLGKLLPEEQAVLWKANKNKFSLFKDLEAGATSKMGSAEFTPSGLSQAVARRSGKVGGSFDNPLQELGYLGEQALENFPSKQGVFQSLAATGAAAGLAGTAYAFADDYPVLTGVAAFLTPFIGAKLASKPGFQKALTGGWAKARNAGMKMDEYQKFLESMGFSSRQIAVGLTTEKE